MHTRFLFNYLLLKGNVIKKQQHWNDNLHSNNRSHVYGKNPAYYWTCTFLLVAPQFWLATWYPICKRLNCKMLLPAFITNYSYSYNLETITFCTNYVNRL